MSLSIVFPRLRHARKEQPETFEDLATAYARANNLRDTELGCEVEEGLLSEVEHALVCGHCRSREQRRRIA